MDYQYKIRLLLRTVPIGIIVGMLGIAISYFAMIRRTERREPKAAFITRYIILPFMSAFYFAVVIQLSLLNSTTMSEMTFSLPLQEYIEAMRKGSTYLMLNILLNVLIFIPFGVFLRMLWSRVNDFKKVISISLLTSSCIELAQMLTKKGAFSCDDVIGSVLGALIGFGIVRAAHGKRTEKTTILNKRIKKERYYVATLMVVTIAVFSLSFWHCKAYAASEDIYYTKIAKTYYENREELSLFADGGDYSYFPDISSIRDISYSDEWFMLELDRDFTGQELNYYGIFYLGKKADTEYSGVDKERIVSEGDTFTYVTKSGVYYELKIIEDDFYFYRVRY